MSILRVRGGNRLEGAIDVYGAKNAVLPILAASIMTRERVVLLGCPMLSDVRHMIEILRSLGAVVEMEGDSITVDARDADSHVMPEELSKQMRSSIFLLGALISRFKQAWVTQPGGCEIGLRPIDLHIKGLRKLNVNIVESQGAIHCTGYDTRGAEVSLDYPSVGATENIMMAAVMAKGRTVIYNAAREPEVKDLAAFINAMGGRIEGAGTGCITIDGVKALHGTTYRIIPDRIVAGTYMAACAITGGDVLIKNVEPAHLNAASAKLIEAGCELDFSENSVRVKAPARLKEMKQIQTQPFPGFPTDLQAQWMAVACVADGISVVSENVFENRFHHATELVRMGADITVKDRIAIVRGVEALEGARVAAKDLRAGAALLLAGLAARGTTYISGEHFINRGYQDLAAELRAVGADITREE
jgi:UDP-N-acetylglucosamine 1-carboxyvinyltransferase